MKEKETKMAVRLTDAKKNLVEAGDVIVLTSGVPAEEVTDCRAVITNNMKVIIFK